uniref:Uncharacterized protein n=1 Tax=Entomoneis paludosa TaxID=265537 RepID=A0A7S3DUT4_9STRA|mmetsp:Transcript_38067/g.79147  ORF Transcript_38067/g.79147 Transcript_38067/m.79147 type:complete len:147 (+) Transcript_38067:1215-1655(+)
MYKEEYRMQQDREEGNQSSNEQTRESDASVMLMGDDDSASYEVPHEPVKAPIVSEGLDSIRKKAYSGNAYTQLVPKFENITRYIKTNGDYSVVDNALNDALKTLLATHGNNGSGGDAKKSGYVSTPSIKRKKKKTRDWRLLHHLDE